MFVLFICAVALVKLCNVLTVLVFVIESFLLAIISVFRRI
jgi:hypothetical protein